MTQSLSVSEARKIVLYSQCLDNRRHFGSGTDGTLEAIEHLGYVQLDTLSVVERAHHHTLWNRLEKFQPLHIDQLQRQGQIFEHWAHALALLPMKNYRYSLPMMNRVAAGDIHWSPKNTKETREILERINAEGPPYKRRISVVSDPIIKCGHALLQRGLWSNFLSRGNS